jgi:uncharacterized membrane protein YqjE
MAQITERRDGEQSEASVAELFKQLSDQTSRLVHDEVELAKAELGEKAKSAGIGAGMFGGAGLFGLYALGALTATLVLVLSTAVAGWLAALIVTVVYGAIAGVLALTGKSKVKKATPPVPEQARDSVKRDIEQTKAHARAGRR